MVGFTLFFSTRFSTLPLFSTLSNSKLPFWLTGENVSRFRWPLRKGTDVVEKGAVVFEGCRVRSPNLDNWFVGLSEAICGRMRSTWVMAIRAESELRSRNLSVGRGVFCVVTDDDSEVAFVVGV
jgi:hypothetical protein